MAIERALVHLLPPLTQGDSWRWLLPEENALAMGELGALAAALAALPTRPVLQLLVPAEAALTTTVAIPSRKLQHIQAAVPNLVEEWLADDLEDLHIAIGERSEAGLVPVAAINRAVLADWLQSLEAAGLTAETAYVDALQLPWQPGELTLIVLEQRALLRWGEYQAGAIDAGQLPLLLEHLLVTWPAGELPPHTLVIHHAEGGAPSEQDSHAAQLPASLVQRHHLSVRQQSLAGLDLTAWLCRTSATPSLQLLQGDFAPRNTRAERWRRWRPAAYAAGLLLALQLLFNLGAGFWLDQRADHWRDQSTDLYRDLFPNDRRLVNLRQQLQNHLDRADTTTASPFLILFSQLAGAIGAAATESPLQLRSLTFDASSGHLLVELIAPSVAVIDVLQKQLHTQGVTATILSASNEGERVIGRLRLVGNAS